MNVTRPTITVVTALVVLVAATAVPAAAMESDGDGAVEAPSDGAGPPTDLPGPVPGFVEDLLGAIQEFVTGLTPGEPASDRPAVAESG